MITILHTNDLHGTFTPEAREKIAAARAEAGPSLLLDAGDACAAGNITFRPGGELILEQMSQLGYDAMTVGNRDFHFSRVGFASKLSRASFPVLCANVRLAGSPAADRRGIEGLVRGSTICDVDGAKVAIFGLTVPMITERMAVRHLSTFVFDDPVATARAIVPELRRSADLVIALTHIGWRRDEQLAMAVPGIDLIIGGHTHLTLDRGAIAGGSLIVQAGSRGMSFGRVTAERSSALSPEWSLRAEVIQV